MVTRIRTFWPVKMVSTPETKSSTRYDATSVLALLRQVIQYLTKARYGSSVRAAAASLRLLLRRTLSDFAEGGRGYSLSVLYCMYFRTSGALNEAGSNRSTAFNLRQPARYIYNIHLFIWVIYSYYILLFLWGIPRPAHQLTDRIDYIPWSRCQQSPMSTAA